ncbi:MAG: D-alanine--D-alanine ligase [Patescibacteria group bacterium]|nr:D-alanine--D-alanine ligase [Patescibacteria group bacterium]
MAKIKLALLSGGISDEREVSLNTGKQIFNALDKKKYEIFQYNPKTDLRKFFLDALNKKFNIVFPALHGPFGEDGKLQGMLDMIGVPYVFSGCLASALAMNKSQTKAIAWSVGINTANSVVLEKADKNRLDQFGFPIVIKPIELGSSIGMAVAKNKKELKDGISRAFKFSKKVMLEQYIQGRELTVAVMGNRQARALPVIEIIPKNSKWFNYGTKYEIGATEKICPAKISFEARDMVQKIAIKIYKALGCEDVARADFIWNEKSGKFYFLEINTIPGMTETSLVPQAARTAGMEFSDFLDKLIKGAIEKNER